MNPILVPLSIAETERLLRMLRRSNGYNGGERLENALVNKLENALTEEITS